ncbi:MAG: hypothetical protein ACOYJN_06055, partial [Acutalibacteraceae bacterium]
MRSTTIGDLFGNYVNDKFEPLFNLKVPEMNLNMDKRDLKILVQYDDTYNKALLDEFNAELKSVLSLSKITLDLKNDEDAQFSVEFMPVVL